MKEIITKVYEYDELDEKAKEKARDWYREIDSFGWRDDYRATLEAFCKRWPIEVRDWAVGYRGYHDARYTGDDDKGELKGAALAKYLWNNHKSDLYQGKYYGKLVPHEKDAQHPAGVRHVKRYSKVLLEPKSLTGFCADDVIMQPLFDVMDGKDTRSTYREVLEDCIAEFFRSWQSAVEEQDEDEAVAENIRANGYTFTETGKRFG